MQHGFGYLLMLEERRCAVSKTSGTDSRWPLHIQMTPFVVQGQYKPKNPRLAGGMSIDGSHWFAGKQARGSLRWLWNPWTSCWNLGTDVGQTKREPLRGGMMDGACRIPPDSKLVHLPALLPSRNQRRDIRAPTVRLASIDPWRSHAPVL
jgi:hypothetical protein